MPATPRPDVKVAKPSIAFTSGASGRRERGRAAGGVAGGGDAGGVDAAGERRRVVGVGGGQAIERGLHHLGSATVDARRQQADLRQESPFEVIERRDDDSRATAMPVSRPEYACRKPPAP